MPSRPTNPFPPAPLRDPLMVRDGKVVVENNLPWSKYFRQLQQNVNGNTFGCCPEVGQWLPVHTAKVNLTSTVSNLAQYSRTGRFVTFSGQFSAQAIAGGMLTSFEMSIPVASAFSFDYEAGGTAGARDEAGQQAAIFASVANGTLTLQWISADTEEHTYNYSGSYWITPSAGGPIVMACPTQQPTVGVPYAVALVRSGGLAPYTFSILAGSLPDGLTLNRVLGVISGTPTVDGTFNYTLGVQDSSIPPLTAEMPCELVVAAAPPSCTPWTTLFGTAALTGIDGIIDAGDFLYGISSDTITGTMPLVKMDRDTGAVIASLPLDTADFQIQALAYDATYIYAGGWDAVTTSKIRVWRVLRSDFATINSIDLTDERRVSQLEVNGLWLYVVPFSNRIEGSGQGVLARVLISDFTTQQRVAWSDGNPTWTKDQQAICIDASYIYVQCRVGASAPFNKFEVSRISNPGFGFVDSFQYDTSLGMATNPNVNGRPLQDATYCYFAFNQGGAGYPVGSPGAPSIMKVDKAAMGISLIQTYLTPQSSGFGVGVLDSEIYLLLSSTYPSLLLKLQTSDLSELARMTQPTEGGAGTVLKDGAEFYMTAASSEVFFTPPGRAFKICSFVPD